MTEIIGLAMAVLAALTVPGAALADDIPGKLASGLFNPELDARLFLKHEPWLLYAEIYDSWQTDSRNQRSVTLGTYYRLLDNLKVGAFYLGQQGVRHDEDWQQGSDGVWHWADTRSRLENVLVLDASPRAELEFLPGTHWVGELKARYFYNFTESDSRQALVLRPGLTYFWLRDGQPFLNFFLQYEMWFPLGFGSKTIYETWAYLGAPLSSYKCGAAGGLRGVQPAVLEQHPIVHAADRQLLRGGRRLGCDRPFWPYFSSGSEHHGETSQHPRAGSQLDRGSDPRLPLFITICGRLIPPRGSQ